jgi:zinc protease
VSLELPPLAEERLPNGATVVVARKKGVPLVAVRLLLRAGSALDPAGRFGLAHLVVAAARRGTRRRGGRRIDEEVEGLGAELGVSADEDASSFGLSAPAEFFSRLLGVVVEVASAPTFPRQEVDRLRRREAASLAHDLDEPGAVADRALAGAVYGAHPYGHPVEGRVRHLAAMRRADVAAFHRRWYGPGVATLVVVGAVDPEVGLRQARRRLAGWRAAAEAPPELPPPGQCPRSVLVLDKPDATQSQVRIALPALPRNSPEYFPAIVASSILGGAFTSRLVEAIRVNRGLSYSVRSRFSMGRASGLFAISTFTKVESTGEIVEVALDEVKRFCDGGPTAEELGRAQGYLSGLFPLSLETHDQVAERICDAKLYGFALAEVAEYPERVRAVTAAQCREVAVRHFPHRSGVVLAVGPAKRIARMLERFGPVRVVPARSVL